MNITEGLNETKFITGFKGFTLDQFKITYQPAEFSEYGNYINQTATLKLKGEVPFFVSDTIHVSYFKHNVTQGVKKSKQKERIAKLIAELDNGKVEINEEIEKNIERFNKSASASVDTLNQNYIRVQKGIYLGDNMSEDFIEENLDDEDLNDEIELLKMKIKRIEEKKKKKEEERAQVRREKMIAIIEKEQKEGGEGYILVPEVASEIVADLKDGKGFKPKKLLFR